MNAEEFEKKFIHADVLVEDPFYPTRYAYENVHVDAVVDLIKKALVDPDMDYDLSRKVDDQTHVSTSFGSNKFFSVTTEIYIYTTAGTIHVCFRFDGENYQTFISLKHNDSNRWVYFTDPHSDVVSDLLIMVLVHINKLIVASEV